MIIKILQENHQLYIAEQAQTQKYSRPRYRYKNLALSTKQKQCKLKIILLLQVSSHDLEPTFIILVLICMM